MRKKEGFQAEKRLVLTERELEGFLRHPLARTMYITDIGYFPLAKHHYRERTSGSPTYILLLCTGGEGWVQVPGMERKSIGKHDLLVIPPGLPHIYGASDSNPWSIYWVHFSGELASHYYGLLSLTNHTAQVNGQDYVRIIELFQMCYSLLSNHAGSLLHGLHASQLLQQVLGIVSLQVTLHSNPVANDYVAQAIRYMKLHLDESLTLTQLADRVNLSRSHFVTLFKTATGVSPVRYFLQLKMEQARLYLEMTGWSVKEISVRLGFKDPLYFSRMFRAETGQSPTQYREAANRPGLSL